MAKIRTASSSGSTGLPGFVLQAVSRSAADRMFERNLHFSFFDGQIFVDGRLIVEPKEASLSIEVMKLLREGQLIKSTYEVERFIGEGAFAEVYRVKHRFLGRQAMKVLKMAGMSLAEAHDMLGEAIILSRIGHQNIIRVYNADLTDTAHGECAFFTMEYVAGGSLENFWRSFGRAFVPVETSVEILRQVCRGLTVAHCEKPPIVHRDIKPQNILVGYDGGGLRARLTDFGLAKRVNPLTLLASARGTLRFKGPEVLQNPQSDSCAGDVWALGCTLYLLLTDGLPYGDLEDEDLHSGKFVARALSLPSSINIEVDGRLDQIVMRSLAPKAKDRYSNAQEMLVQLESWVPSRKFKTSSKSASSSEINKSALGRLTPPDPEEARKLASKAIELARQPNKLREAADLLEEALNKSQDLRGQYEYRLQLWRKGVIT
jgi:serine/threonine-protein kinase